MYLTYLQTTGLLICHLENIRIQLSGKGRGYHYNFNKVAEQIPRYGSGQLICPRLGQGSFRFAVGQAYQQTITPDYYFKVSERLNSEYHNGKIYYEMNAHKICLPDNPLNKPSQENLEYHQNHIFLK